MLRSAIRWSDRRMLVGRVSRNDPSKFCKDDRMPETTDTPMLNERFGCVLALALKVHHRQVRTSTDIPYAGHLMVVAGTVLEHGGDETEASAALLDDAVDDQGGAPAYHARAASLRRGRGDSAGYQLLGDPWGRPELQTATRRTHSHVLH